MNRIIFALSLVIACCVQRAFADEDLSKESYLCWMVGEVTPQDRAQSVNYDAIRIKAVKNGETDGYLMLGNIEEGTWNPYISNPEQGLIGVTPEEIAGFSYYASLGAYAGDGWGYVIELLKDNDVQAFSETYNYGTTDSIVEYTAGHFPEMITATAWGGGTYTVPEPNSALLLMLGLAGLVLRRRQMKA